jgi:polar amino acid transport system ATP-binding protein
MSAPAPQTAAKALVELEGIHLSFGDNQVLKGIDLTVNKGDAVSIIGPSGSGKSTLLRCINGLVPIQRGSIRVADFDVHTLRTDHERIALRKRIGIVFQQFNLFPLLTVMENITIAPIKILGTPKAEAERHARELLEKVRLSQKVDAYPGQLSGGQQQRVAIARALAMRPELVLFDEVTSALDPETVGEVLAVIRDLVNDGMTSILVTHEMRFAEEISDNIVFTENGLIVDQGTPEHIFYRSTNPRINAFVKGLGGQVARVADGEGI